MADILDAGKTTTQTQQSDPPSADSTAPAAPPAPPTPLVPDEPNPMTIPEPVPPESATPEPMAPEPLSPVEETPPAPAPTMKPAEPIPDIPISAPTISDNLIVSPPPEPAPTPPIKMENNPQDVPGKGKKKSKIGVLVASLLLLVITLPILVVFVRQQMEIRSRAYESSTTKKCLRPSECASVGTFTSGCSSACTSGNVCCQITSITTSIIITSPPKPSTTNAPTNAPTSPPSSPSKPCKSCVAGNCIDTHISGCRSADNTCSVVGSPCAGAKCEASRNQYASVIDSCTTAPICDANTGVWTCPTPTCIIGYVDCPTGWTCTGSAVPGTGSQKKYCVPGSSSPTCTNLQGCPAGWECTGSVISAGTTTVVKYCLPKTPPLLEGPCQYSCNYSASQCQAAGGTQSPYACPSQPGNVCCNIPGSISSTSSSCTGLTKPGCSSDETATCLFDTALRAYRYACQKTTPECGRAPNCISKVSPPTCDKATGIWTCPESPALPPGGSIAPACNQNTVATIGESCINGGTFNGKCIVFHCPIGCGGDRCDERSPGVWWEYKSCASANLAPNECGQIDTVTDAGRYCQPASGCDVKILRCTDTCSGGPTPAPPIQCINIIAYKDGNALSSTELSALHVGDTITLAFAPGGAATKARFRVNSTSNADWHETTTKNANSQFTWDYTLANTTSFNIEAQGFDGRAWY